MAKLAQKGSEGNPPIRRLQIIIDVNRREELFDQLQKFANKHAFRLLIRDVEVIPEGIFIEMYRDDLEIHAGSDSDDPTLIELGIYNRNPAHPMPEEIVDELFNNLKSFINEIPNVMMTEMRKSLTITIDESQREELFTQLRKLADKYSLEFTLSFGSDKTVFLAEISGDGFHITIEPVIGSPREINIVFFIDYYNVPTLTSQETMDELFDELKSLLSEIPNVSITEEN